MHQTAAATPPGGDHGAGERTGLPRVAIFDLDGTLSRRDLFLVFLAYAARQAGIAKPWRAMLLPALTGRYMLRGIPNHRLKEAYLDAVLGGRPRATVEALADAFVAMALSREIKPAAVAALARHRAAGDALVLASASLDIYVAPLARGLGFDACLSTPTAWTEDGRVAGRLAGPNLRGAAKTEAVRAYLSEHFPAGAEVTAYSDHETDAALLAEAAVAVAVDPTRALRAIAAARGWRIADWRGPADATASSP